MTRLTYKCICLAALAAGCGSVTTSSSKTGEPTISSLMPDHGPTDGGIMVTISGENLTGNPLVLVGGHEATMVSASGSSLTFMLPAGDQEGATVDVTVADDHGFVTKAGGFRYTFRPVILSVTPGVGKSTGGTAITITGRGFTADDAGLPTITLAGGMATNIQVASDTMITLTTGAAGAGVKAFFPQDVVLTNVNGTATLKDSFSVSNQGLIVLEGGCCNPTHAVLFVDPANGSFAKIGTVAAGVHGCALGPNGKVFAVGNWRRQGQHCSLVTFDPVTGMQTAIGLLNDGAGTGHCPTTLAFIGNSLFALDTELETPCCGTVGRLSQIDPNTGAVTVIGAAAFDSRAGGAIGPKDGSNVWWIKTGTGTLNTVAVASSTVTTGPALTGGTSSLIRGITNIGSTFFIVEHNSPSTIYSTNTTSGALTKVSTIPFRVGGMCQTPPSF